MYQHHVTSFGEFQKHTFENTLTKNSFSLVPEFGACVLDIVFQGNSVIDGYQTPTELRLNKWGKNCVLFPFPNRLKDGIYQWGDDIYRFPINDSHTGNALHGFGMNKNMTIKKVKTTKEKAEITCVYTDLGEHEYYPFLFTFEITFSINNQQAFQVAIAAENNGTQAMPIGWGWHPYFKLSEKVDTVQLQVPACEWIGIDGQMIPTGKRYDYDEFIAMKAIKSTVLDNGFAISSEGQGARFEVVLKTDKHQLNYWQSTGENQYNFIQLFTPSYRGSIAIEPMTCNIDAFNNKEGLIVLEPGKRVENSFGFGYQ